MLKENAFDPHFAAPVAWLGFTGGTSPVMSFNHVDRLGSVVAVSTAGAIAYQYSYMPWGESAALSTGFGYAGYRYDAETGLYYVRARYYDPRLGRFLEPDPLGQAPGLNVYAYVGGNPLNRTDRRGLQEEDEGLGPVPELEGPAGEPGEQPQPSPVHDPQNPTGGPPGLLSPPAEGGTAPQQCPPAAGSPLIGNKLGDPANNGTGCIYCVPGANTPSGKPYVGRTGNPSARVGDSSDGRDRSQAAVVNTYPQNDTNAGRAAEQQEINNQGGVNNLDNMRNEIAPSKQGSYGVTPGQ